MKPAAIRLAVLGALVVGTSFGLSHVAHAQGNTDDAHALCAQGGGSDGEGGAGAPNLGDGGAAGAGAGNEAGLAAIGNGLPGEPGQGGAGGGGAGGGLGGSIDEGGGAGGCLPVEETPAPVVIQQQVVRRLPVTGSSADRFGFAGAAFVLAGGALVVARRRMIGKQQPVAEGLVWDAFGRPN